MIFTAFAKLEGTLDITQVLDLCHQSDWDRDIVTAALGDLLELWTLNRCCWIFSWNRQNRNVIITAFIKLEDRVKRFTGYRTLPAGTLGPWFFDAALIKSAVALTLNKLLNSSRRISEFDTKLSLKVFSKLDGTLDIASFENLPKVGWKPNIITGAFTKLEGSLDLAQLGEICKQSGWNLNVESCFALCLERFNAAQFMELAQQSDWNRDFIISSLNFPWRLHWYGNAHWD